MRAQIIAANEWLFFKEVEGADGPERREIERIIMPASVLTEEQALDVFQQATEPLPASMADVKAEAARRLAETDWMVLRAAEGERSVPLEVADRRRAIRDVSGRLERMSPVPSDYMNDKWWF